MSVSAYYYLADWDTFVARYAEAGNADEYYKKYYDSEQPWLQAFEPTMWHKSHSWSPQTTAFLFHEEIAEHLKPDLRKRLESFLQSFGLIQGEVVNDLGKDTGYFAIAISPNSVRELLKTSLLLDFEDFRSYYENYYNDDNERWLETFDALKEYLQGFVDILAEANRNSMGVVIWIA